MGSPMDDTRMIQCRLFVPILLCVLAVVPPAGLRAEDMAMATPDPGRKADTSMMAGMRSMQRSMDRAPVTGDPDRDFVSMMMPHHRGAIEMAKVELRYGRDPELRRLARDVVAAQQREIAEMDRWAASHPEPVR